MKTEHPRPRILAGPFDHFRALLPLALCLDPWPVIQSRARCDLHQINEAAARNRKGGRA